MRKFSTIIGLLLLMACTSRDDTRIYDYTITEKDLIPEGVAFDENTQTVYISSTYKRKIVAIDKDGNTRDFISGAQDDIRSVIGMEVDEKTNSIWAVSCEAADVLPLVNPGKDQWRSSVYRFNLKDGKLIGKYSLDKDSVFMNDLTVGDDGTVYITESVQKGLYIVKPGSDTLEFFLQLDPRYFINGICFSDKPGILFVATESGIARIDLATKNFSLLPEAGPLKAADIDGLSFWDNYFIAHQSTAVTRFYLSPGRDSIIHADTLNSGKEFNSSTTGEVAGGHYYFIVNSQVRSGIDFENKRLKPMDSLSNVIIRKIRL